MDIKIQLQNINKSFHHRPLFQNFSFTFQQHVYHIMGDNGVGKSTLLRLIVGLDVPDSGRVVLQEHDVVSQHDTHAKKLFYVPDDLAIYPFLTGNEFLSWIAPLRTNDLNEVKDLIAQFELQAYLHMTIAEMSLGTKKKFLLISALIGQPGFIILDEPLNALDQKSQDVLVSLLHRKSSQSGVLLTSHDDAPISLLHPKKVRIVDGGLAAYS